MYCLSLHLLMDIWVIFRFWLLEIKLLWIFEYRSLFGYLFSLLLLISKSEMAELTVLERYTIYIPISTSCSTYAPSSIMSLFLIILVNVSWYLMVILIFISLISSDIDKLLVSYWLFVFSKCVAILYYVICILIVKL